VQAGVILWALGSSNLGNDDLVIVATNFFGLTKSNLGKSYLSGDGLSINASL